MPRKLTKQRRGAAARSASAKKAVRTKRKIARSPKAVLNRKEGESALARI